MKEWNSPYNPFNSMKVLTWREHLEGIAKQNFLPPVTVDIDPSNRCNYDCEWCNAFDNMKCNHDDISLDHLYRIADFCKEWGVYSACIAGGGEPLMNKDLGDFLLRLKNNGIESGIITNGSLLSNDIAEIIAVASRWCGISMDAGTPETYVKVKGINNLKMFDKVINNISNLTSIVNRLGTNCDVAYKYLLHPFNAHEILIAAKLAKSIGVKDFHLRPVGWDNLTKTKNKHAINFEPLLDNINEQIEEAMKLESENFHFYGIRHKFQPSFKKKVQFERCWAAPLLLTFGADGNCHLCFDMRGRKDLILCSHYPDPHEVLKHWNSERHKSILENIDITKCPRCTFGPYQEMVEKVFIKDGMCRFFP